MPLEMRRQDLTGHETPTCWYALLTRSRHEKVASTALEQAGICTFLPMVTEVHRWSDRRKLVETPLFPGYVFVRIRESREAQVHVLRASGVVRFVGNRAGALPIPDSEITQVQMLQADSQRCSPYPFLRAGDKVRIVGGAFEGVEGILISQDGDRKLVVSINLIQRSVAISLHDVEVQSAMGHG
jgi:transcription termination/antitermination protein NusG